MHITGGMGLYQYRESTSAVFQNPSYTLQTLSLDQHVKDFCNCLDLPCLSICDGMYSTFFLENNLHVKMLNRPIDLANNMHIDCTA